MSIPRLTLIMLVVFCAGVLPAHGAEPQVAGRWQATEFDPFIPENPLFGQYRYILEIMKGEDGYQIHISRFGATLRAGPLAGDRLTAQGSDPNRGPLTLDVRLAATHFEGTLVVNGQEKRITASLAPEDQLAKVKGATQAAVSAAATAKARETDLQAQVDRLNARIAELERQLARSETQRQSADQQLEDARARLRDRPAAPVTISQPAAPAAPRAGTPAAPAPALTIDIIDPPGVGDGTRVTVPPTAGRDLVGRIDGPVRLFSASINGAPLRVESNGLFRTNVTPDEGGAAINIVAVDRDGRRATMAFTLVPETARTAAGVPATDDASDRERCYHRAIATTPDEAALDICRRAMTAETADAIDHYHLAVALSRLGRHAEALAAYRDAAARWSR